MIEKKTFGFIEKLWNKLPNKYLLVLIFYITYMFFFDSNNIPSQYKLWSEVRALKKERAIVQQKLIDVKKERDQLFTDDETLEKFARENYYVKKDDETLFVITTK